MAPKPACDCAELKRAFDFFMGSCCVISWGYVGFSGYSYYTRTIEDEAWEKKMKAEQDEYEAQTKRYKESSLSLKNDLHIGNIQDKKIQQSLSSGRQTLNDPAVEPSLSDQPQDSPITREIKQSSSSIWKDLEQDSTTTEIPGHVLKLEERMTNVEKNLDELQRRRGPIVVLSERQYEEFREEFRKVRLILMYSVHVYSLTVQRRSLLRSSKKKASYNEHDVLDLFFLL